MAGRLRAENLVDDVPLRAALPRRVDRTLRVVDGEGRPVAGVRIHVSAGRSFSAGAEVMPADRGIDSETDENGLLTIVGVPCGPATLYLVRGDKRPAVRNVVIDADGESPLTTILWSRRNPRDVGRVAAFARLPARARR